MNKYYSALVDQLRANMGNNDLFFSHRYPKVDASRDVASKVGVATKITSLICHIIPELTKFSTLVMLACSIFKRKLGFPVAGPVEGVLV